MATKFFQKAFAFKLFYFVRFVFSLLFLQIYLFISILLCVMLLSFMLLLYFFLRWNVHHSIAQQITQSDISNVNPFNNIIQWVIEISIHLICSHFCSRGNGSQKFLHTEIYSILNHTPVNTFISEVYIYIYIRMYEIFTECSKQIISSQFPSNKYGIEILLRLLSQIHTHTNLPADDISST